MGGVPEESDEEKRARKAAERRARRDRIIQNQEFLTDRTSFLRRQFGRSSGNIGAAPLGNFFGRIQGLAPAARGREVFSVLSSLR